jgi:integrase
MGTILKRPRQDGTVAYLAQIAINRKGVTHREAQTFDRERYAKTWIEKRETELAKPGALTPGSVARREGKTLAHAIDRYTSTSKKAIGRTKAQVLRSIKEGPLGELNCSEITSRDLVGYAQILGASAKPQTVNNYMSHLAAVFAIARPAWGFDLDQAAMSDAQKVMKRLGLTAKSQERDRRPTLDERDRFLTHFADRRTRRPSSNPMVAIVAFALFSSRRLEEITRIKWADFDEGASRILVRDMKNPGEKAGNNVRCDLPPEAVRIINSLPRVADEIVPCSPDAITAAFTRACKLLAIDDLHFHDLRHEGISRLFELGWNIPHVAAVSGHRSWQSLKRYTHIRQTGDKYENWAWLKGFDPIGAQHLSSV